MSITSDITDIKQILSVQALNLAVNNEQLTQHMRRTELLELEVRNMRKFNYILIGIFTALQVLLPFMLRML